MKNGTVLLKKEPYTRKKGLDAFVEYTVVGETEKSLLVTRYPTRGLEKAEKVPKKSDLTEYGFFKNWDEVKNHLYFDNSSTNLARMVAKLKDVNKLKMIEDILRDNKQQSEMPSIPQPIPLKAIDEEKIKEAVKPRRKTIILRKRGAAGRFVKGQSRQQDADNSVH